MKKLLLVIILFMFISCMEENRVEGPIIALVENSTLSVAEAEQLKLAVSSQSYSINDVVASWIDRELLYLAARNSGLENDASLNSQIKIYQKDLLGRTFMDNYVASQISIENEEIKAYYDKNRHSFKHQNDGAKIIHFFITTDSIAQFIYNALKQPRSSIDRKKLLSDYNANVTIVEKGNLLEQLDSEIFSNNRSNFIIGPVKSDYGYHVVEVLGRYKAGSQITLDEAYDQVYQRLFNQKKALGAIGLLDSLRNHYTVKTNLENN